MKNTGAKATANLDTPTTKDGYAYIVGEIYWGVDGSIEGCEGEYERKPRTARVQPLLCVAVKTLRSGYEVRLKGSGGCLRTIKWDGASCPSVPVYADESEAVLAAASTYNEIVAEKQLIELEKENEREADRIKGRKAKIATLRKCIATNGKSQVSTDGVRQQVAQLRKMARAGGTQ